MNFRDFRINIFFRIVVLTLTMLAFVVVIGKAGYMVTGLVLGTMIIFQVIRLIKYVEHTNYEIINFLNGIQFDDFSNNYELSYGGKSYTDLNLAFQNVLKRFKEVRQEKESNYQQLRLILQHIGVGILAIRQSGEIDFMNNAAKRILKISRLTQISQFKMLSSLLLEKTQNLQAGDKTMVTFRLEGEMVSFLLYATEINLNKKDYRLLTIQNIHPELEEQELEAWDKLIKVLIHEIMNSITPITSLAEIVNSELDYLQQSIEQGLSEADFEDAKSAMNTIQKRGDSLSKFVQDFRSLTTLPNPQFKNLIIKNVFEEVLDEFKDSFKEHQIQTSISVNPENLVLTADENLLKQLLHFLIKNAIEAENNPESPKIIHLIAQQDDKNSRPILIVRDNGVGIDEDALERVFIPFFSTKRNASGVGLSFSRLIMRQHKGSIVAKSRGGTGTDIVLRF